MKFVSWNTVLYLLFAFSLLMVAMTIVLASNVSTAVSSERDLKPEEHVKYALMSTYRGDPLQARWPRVQAAWARLGIEAVCVCVGAAQVSGLKRFDSVPERSDRWVAEHVLLLYGARLPGMTVLASLEHEPREDAAAWFQGPVAEASLEAFVLYSVRSTDWSRHRVPLIYAAAQQRTWHEANDLPEGATIQQLQDCLRTWSADGRASERFFELVTNWGTSYEPEPQSWPH